MSEQPSLKFCPRCNAENHVAFNFCWLCGLDLNDPQKSTEQATQVQQHVPAGVTTATSVGTGIAGVFAGVAGGIVIGVLMVIAFIVAILNAIQEMFEGCASLLIFATMAISATIYSIISWFF